MEKEPTSTQLEELGERARRIAASSSDSNSGGPRVIEFAGSPKAGKSTTIDILTHFLKRNGLKIWAPTEGASKRTPYHLKRDLVAFNTWTLNYAVSELLIAYHNVDPHHLVILDRGPFDSLAWMGVLKNREKLNADEYDIIRAFALHPRWTSLISRVYLFSCEPEISLARENMSKLTTLGGTAMNPTMLNDLLHEYKELKQSLISYPVLPIHTSSKTTPKATTFEIATDVISLMEEGCRG